MNVKQLPRRLGTIRRAMPDEEPDFVQRIDKLHCTGMVSQGFVVEFEPPIVLNAGVGYKILFTGPSEGP